MTPDQTAKTITKFLYGGYISIFGALARLLSDRGTSFTSSIIEELCKILGVQQLWTMPHHPQTNGLVERSHQMIMHMIGKLGEDKKANWPSHLAEIAQLCLPHLQSTAEACQQKWYYDRKIGTVNLKPGDLVLVKADAWKGKRKIKDRWDEETWEVS